jgi:ribosomal protein L7Ae-like RNA K-turn-binding protein
VEEKVKSLLGLARKAGKVVLGQVGVKNAIAKGRLSLLILAKDCSGKTGEKFLKLTKGEIAGIQIFSKEELGKIWGKSQIGVAGVLDQNFAQALLKELKNQESRSI